MGRVGSRLLQGCHSIFNTKFPDFSLTFDHFPDFQSKRSDTFLCNIYENMHDLYLSTPKGIDYVVIGFDMEVQPLVTHNAV